MDCTNPLTIIIEIPEYLVQNLNGMSHLNSPTCNNLVFRWIHYLRIWYSEPNCKFQHLLTIKLSFWCLQRFINQIICLTKIFLKIRKFSKNLLKRFNNYIVFVWSRNGVNWTKAFEKDSWRQNSILWEEQRADPPIAYITSVNVMYPQYSWPINKKCTLKLCALL